jgi:flagellar hook-length control protein FliK
MMTIVIAPILAKLPVQPAGTDNSTAAETAIAGADFARLLLGQLTVNADLKQGIATNPGTPVTADTLKAKALETEALDPTASPQDAAMLLASLGMTPAQKIETSGVEAGAEMLLPTDTRLVGSDRKLSAISLAGPPANSNVADTARPDAFLEAVSNIQSSWPAPLESDQNAAKFAALKPDDLKIDAVSIKSVPNEFGAAQQAPAAAALSPQASNAAPTPSNVLRMDTHVRDIAWPVDFTQKVVWLTTNDQKSAQITLNPPQMGPIEISLNINKDSASAYFVSANAEVREAIETALPRLREMLAGVGIELGQANVSAQSQRQEGGNPEGRQAVPRWMSDEAILNRDSGPSQAVINRQGSGLVDTFA